MNELDPTMTINDVEKAIKSWISQLDIQITQADFDRPWGGFFVIDDASTRSFIEQFFPDHSYEDIAHGLTLTPKILVVAPGMRLSWQYHHRREEIWRIVSGPVGVITSTDDQQGDVKITEAGKVVSFGTEIRHRLVGLDNYGIVAEFWKHTDPSRPSNEDDIVRVADDFSR